MDQLFERVAISVLILEVIVDDDGDHIDHKFAGKPQTSSIEPSFSTVQSALEVEIKE